MSQTRACFAFADSAGGFEAHLVPGSLTVFPNGPGHDQAHGEVGVHLLLSGGGLDEIGSRHHADQAGLVDVREGAQLAGGQDRLQVGASACLPERSHLVVESLPVSREDVASTDDDVDLRGPGRHRGFDLGQPEGKGESPWGKPAETAATGIPEPSRACTAVSTIWW